MKHFLNKKITVVQTGSHCKLTIKQKSNLIGLGLRGINSDSNLFASQEVLGMLRKVKHVASVKLNESGA